MRQRSVLPEGRECTRCHGAEAARRDPNCRDGRAEALVYRASLALWQRRMPGRPSAVIVPSVFVGERSRELGAPLDRERVHVLAPPVSPEPKAERHSSEHSPLSSPACPEKGIDVAIEGCRSPECLCSAGDGRQMGPSRVARARAQGTPKWNTHTYSRTRAGVSTHGYREAPKRPEWPMGQDGGEVHFLGRVDDATLERLRKEAALAIVPSRSAETFAMAAAEAMAAGLPVVASRVGALPELVEESALVEPGDPVALAQAIGRLWGDTAAGEWGRTRVSELCGPETVADGLRRIYAPDNIQPRPSP